MASQGHHSTNVALWGQMTTYFNGFSGPMVTAWQDTCDKRPIHGRRWRAGWSQPKQLHQVTCKAITASWPHIMYGLCFLPWPRFDCLIIYFLFITYSILIIVDYLSIIPWLGLPRRVLTQLPKKPLQGGQNCGFPKLEVVGAPAAAPALFTWS